LPIPITIDRLLEKRIVEQSRIEYKKGWNQLEILRSICAFANDIDNSGGGYIIVGVDADNGIPILPPEGLPHDSLDRIQKELLELVRSKLRPQYAPIAAPVEYQGKHLLMIWVPGGYDRPYKAAVSLSKDKSESAYYVRRYSNTVKANDREIKELHALGEDIPFDDRINRQARLENLSFNRIASYLKRVNSALVSQLDDLSLRDIALSMRIAEGPVEYTRPLNVGLLFFANNPEDYIREVHIEVTYIPNPTGEGMIERVFTGPLDEQLENALLYLKSSVVAEMIHKIPGQAEAERHFNYPYEAIEEALSNAVYHKSYQIVEPIIVRIEKDNLSILSNPGPDRSITDEDLKSFHMYSKHNRNRRIGDFLKELGLVEEKNTGVPTMISALEANGSKPPVFETDEERSYFRVVFEIHDNFKKVDAEKNDDASAKPVSAKRRSRAQIKTELLEALEGGEYSQNELAKLLGYATVTNTLIATIKELLADDIIAYTSEKQNDPKTKLMLCKSDKSLN
jgi:ATP-dependent DNA helicase RecG